MIRHPSSYTNFIRRLTHRVQTNLESFIVEIKAYLKFYCMYVTYEFSYKRKTNI